MSYHKSQNRLEIRSDSILEDMDIVACKIGMIGSIKLLEVIVNELAGLNIPVVTRPSNELDNWKAIFR